MFFVLDSSDHQHRPAGARLTDCFRAAGRAARDTAKRHTRAKSVDAEERVRADRAPTVAHVAHRRREQAQRVRQAPRVRRPRRL